MGYIVQSDLTLEPCYIARCDNSFAHGDTLHEAVSDATGKAIRKKPVDERIDEFIAHFGSVDSIHKGQEFYDWHNILTGSCKMGRNQFCNENGIDLNADYTVGYFLNITSSSYGSDVIRRIRERYEED